MNTAQDFVNLFVDGTGELLYFIAIFMIYQATLLMALGQRARSQQEMAAGRYSAGLLLTTLAWLSLMGGALWMMMQGQAASNLLPVLERVASTVALVALSWALLTAEYEGRLGRSRLVAGLLVLLAVGGFVYTRQEWDPAVDFNSHSLNAVWMAASLSIAAGSALLLLTRFRSVADIPLKLLFFVVMGAGHGYTLYRDLNGQLAGDAAGAVRWAFLTGSGLLGVIVYRMVIERMREAIDEVATYAETISKPVKAITALQTNELSALGETVTGQTPGTASLGGRNEMLELLKALGIMLDEPDTDILPQQIVMAVAQGLKADIVAVMASDEETQWVDIVAAYDQINDRSIAGMSMNLEDQPTLVQAITDKKQKHLPIEGHDDELRDMYTRLDVEPIGPAYFQPLSRNGIIVGLLLIGFPYTHRDLRTNDLRLLESIGPVAARLLVISRTAIQKREEAEQQAIQAIVEGEMGEAVEENRAKSAAMQANLQQAQIQIRELNRLVTDLEADLEKERGRVQELLADGEDAMSVTQRIQTISTERQQLREEREKLSNALIEARASLISVTAEDDPEAYETMIDDLQQEYEELQAHKASLEQQIKHMRAATNAASAGDSLNEMLEALSAEKAQIAADRDALAAQLEQTRSQLEALGIEDGVVGLARQIAQLNEEKLYYKAQAEKALQERETLLGERRKLEAAIADEAQRDARLKGLEEEMARLMKDREALVKSRDNLKMEREALLEEREAWRGERARMLAHNDSLKMELDETLELLNEANQERQELSARLNELTAEFDRLRATATRSQNERDALLARIEGDRERLREVGAEGVGALTQMINDLTEERSDLEKKLAEARQSLQNLKWEHIQLQGSRDAAPPVPSSVDAGTIRALAQELVGPLSAISHYSDVMMGESVGALSALQEEFMTRIKANLDRLNRLIGDLVQAASLLQTGEMALNPQPLNLVDVIDDAITASRHKFSEKGIVLDLDISTDEIQVEADRAALRQILNELIDNAYVVSPNDSSVRVAAGYQTNGGSEEASRVYVAVTDQGGGVPRNMYDVVFNRINRTDNTLIPGLGHSGLELALIKGLVEAHQGEVSLETEEGVGTTFRITLPVKATTRKPA